VSLDGESFRVCIVVFYWVSGDRLFYLWRK